MDGRAIIVRMRSWSMLVLGLVFIVFLVPTVMHRDRNAFAATGNFAPNEFVTTWRTDMPGADKVENSAADEIYLKTFNSGTPYVYNFNVDWGDGTTSTGLTQSTLHKFPASGTYQVKITGQFPAFLAGEDAKKLVSVDQWGTNKWQTTAQAFYLASNVQFTAADNPDLSEVTNAFFMFYGASSFNSDINDWDVSNLTFMADMFTGAFAFNQPLNDWDVSNVTNFANMFYGASSFNQPLNDWDVSNATTMKQMFAGASSFDQTLGSWNVSKVTDMEGMFIRGATPANLPGGSGMLSPSGLSLAHYDATLIAWSELDLTNNVKFDAGTSTYCDAEEERASIIATFTWVIQDSGANCAPVETSSTTTTLPSVTTTPDTATSGPVSTATVTSAPEVNVAGISLSSLPKTGGQIVQLMCAALLFIVIGGVSVKLSRGKHSLLK